MGTRTWTIREVLEWAVRDFENRAIENPRLDAELLVAHALGIDRIGLYLDLNRPLLERERSAIRPLVARRREREPVAYIIGHRQFYGRRFAVTRDVLIPRPDTEILVEHALEHVPEDAPCRILDVGTGSGAIAASLAAERPLAQVTATDVSDRALVVAAGNAEALGVADRIDFVRANLIAGEGFYDVVVSNPPYVTSTEMQSLQPEVRDYEPRIALEAGRDGLDVIRALLEAAPSVTRTGAHFLSEVGFGQASSVLRLAEGQGAWTPVAVYPDLDRIERVVHLRRI